MQENYHGAGKLQRHCVRFFWKNYRPFACPVPNVCNGYQKQFAPFTVSLFDFGYCAVNGCTRRQSVPMTSKALRDLSQCRKITTVQENYNGISLRFFCKNYRPFACPVSNVCNGYLKLFAPFAVSLFDFGFCAVNGAFAPVARRCR